MWERSIESCKTLSNLMNEEEFRSFNFLILKYKGLDQIIQPFYRTGSPKKSAPPPPFVLKKLQKCEKSRAGSCRMLSNLMNQEENYWVKCSEIPTKKSEKSTGESCRINWNLKTDEKFGSFNFLILKYKGEDKIVQLFYRNGYPRKLGSSSLIWRHCKNWEKYRWSM